jgi:hypothetical protein
MQLNGVWHQRLRKMKIGNTGPIGVTSARRRDRAASTSTGFSKEISADTPAVAAQSAGGIAPLSSLLSLQEVNDPLQERQRAIKHGEDLLEELDELRYGLLIGSYPEEKLNRILAMVKSQQGRLADPRLKEIVGEIELRAAVELAKLGQIP